MKKIFAFFLIAMLALSLVSCKTWDFFYKVENIELVVENYKYNYANDQQASDTTKLFMVDSKLYVYNRDAGALYVINKDGTSKILDIPNTWDCIVTGNDVYYCRYENSNATVYHRNLFIEKENCIYKSNLPAILSLKDGVVYAGSDKTNYYSITNGVMSSDPVSTAARFVDAFDKRYLLTPDELVIVDGDEKKTVEEIASSTSKIIVATENGIAVHNEDDQKLLYLIDGETDKVTELFAVECMASDAAMNIYGDNVYLSVYRYEKWGELKLAMVGYENDQISGTYQINLKTGETKKISDKTYVALYIFDSTGIYAVEKNGETYKLDFDGNVIQTIISTVN